MKSFSLDTKTKVITSTNILSITVGTNTPKGGDSGHGGRTYLCLKNEASTDLRVRVDEENEFMSADKVELILGGDSEVETLITAFEYAIEVLKEQRQNNMKLVN